MVDDKEIQREVWDGKIPVCFQLSSDEKFTMEEVDTYFMLVPRNTYLPLVSDKVQKHFSKYTDPEQSGEFWVEYESQPLKWHYPFGVLFDLHGADSSLPWQLTVHFQDFPETELLHCSNREVVEAHFMACVKEADALKHRGQVINSMQKKDHKQLWSGLVADKFDQFWTVNKRLMGSNGDGGFRAVPFKLHCVDQSFQQALIKPKSEDGTDLTLNDLLEHVMPECLNTDQYRILTHGMELPLEATLQWLSENLSYPDNFLHICVVKKHL